MRTRISHTAKRSTLAAIAAVAVVGGVAIATPAFAADSDIRINEVQSKGGADAPDFIELTNIGTEPVDVSGWIVRDGEDDHALPIADGTVIEPGAFFVVEPDAGDDGFGLGKGDSARIFAADGETLVDEYTWADGEHATSDGRLPDGTGEFLAAEPTPGAANVEREADEEEPEEPADESDALVVVNEVETNGDARGDWVELGNADPDNSVDLTGWTLIDGDQTHEPVVLDGEIESGGYLAFLTEPNFGLGGEDEVTARDADGAVVDTVSWAEHAETTLARCPDMTGDFQVSGGGTYELANNCDDAAGPQFEVAPWPYGNEPRDAVAAGTWGDDMSGIDVAAEGTVYAVNNDAGEISRLAGGPDTYTVDTTWQPTYTDGTGTPDGEGIAVADDGAVYLATERNNDTSDVSRPSVLRYELTEGGGAIVATHEWNLADLTGTIGANGGAEAIEWISDDDALAAGLDYDPAAYGEHFGGLFAVGIEETGTIHVVVLEEDGSLVELQAIEASEAVSGVMGLDWRAGGNQLFAQCDEACDNRSAEFRISGGRFERVTEYAAPTGMDPSYTNEGIAMTWCNAEPGTTPTVLWMSDSAHEGVSLRVAQGDCSESEGDDGGDDENPYDGDSSGDGDEQGAVSVQAVAERGETVAVTVEGMAGDEVDVWLHSEPRRLVTGTVGSDDTIRITIPDDAELGEHEIVVNAEDGSHVGSAPIEIVAAAAGHAASDDGLAVTGSEFSSVLPLAALGLVLVGGALVLRRRVRA